MEESQCGHRVSIVFFGKTGTLLAIPCYLVKVNPVVRTVKLVRLIVIRVHTIQQCFYFLSVSRAINRYHTIATSHDAFRSFCSRIIRRLQKKIIDIVLCHVFRIVVSHSNDKRNLSFIEDTNHRLPTINGRIFSYYISTQYGNIRMFRFQDGADGRFCFSTRQRSGCPMQIRKLGNFKLPIFKRELLLRKNHSRDTTRQHE